MLRVLLILATTLSTALSFHVPSFLPSTLLQHTEAASIAATQHFSQHDVAAALPTLLLSDADPSIEYGSVDAPIGLAWGLGVAAILTSFLPVLLQPGEKALEDMRENEKYSFGKGRDVLKGRKVEKAMGGARKQGKPAGKRRFF